MSKIDDSWDEIRKKTEKVVYTVFLSLIYIINLIGRYEEKSLSILTLLSTISYILYILCLIYTILHVERKLLLTSAFITALLFIFSDLLYVMAVYPLNNSFSLQLVVSFSVVLMVFFSYFLAKIMYRKFFLQKRKYNNHKIVKMSTIIFSFGLMISFMFRAISKNMTEISKLCFFIPLYMIAFVFLQSVSFTIVLKEKNEK